MFFGIALLFFQNRIGNGEWEMESGVTSFEVNEMVEEVQPDMMMVKAMPVAQEEMQVMAMNMPVENIV